MSNIVINKPTILAHIVAPHLHPPPLDAVSEPLLLLLLLALMAGHQCLLVLVLLLWVGNVQDV